MEFAGQQYPLTVAQRGLWMASFLGPSDSTFNIAEAITLRGRIDETLFMRTLAQVAAEAETLRTRIIETSDGPQQQILPDTPNDFPVVDFRDADDPRAAARDWMAARIRAPINMRTDQLWQNALVRIADDHFIWFHCCHHAVLDGYSGGLVAARAAAIYSALAAGEVPGPTPFLPLAALLEQEAIYRGSERQRADRAYWRDYLAELPAPVTLSLHPQRRPSGQHGGFISRGLLFPQDRVDLLSDMARTFDATLPQALTALVVAYLVRVTGTSDLVVGMPVSGRANRVLRHTPGMAANAVALLFNERPETSFVDLMAQARRAMRGALRHQQFRYEDLRRELGLFDTGQQIARIGINIEPFDYKLDFAGIRGRDVNLSNGAMEDLTIFVFNRKDGEGLTIQFDANPALYTGDELDSHLARLEHLAVQLMTDPHGPLGGHDILTPADRRTGELRARAVTRAWAYDHLTPMLETALIARPAALAVVDGHGSITHGELWRQIQLLATRLNEFGVEEGEIVAIAVPRDRRMIIAMAAIAAAGAAWLPVDLDGPPSRTEAILADADPALVIGVVERGVALDPVWPHLLLGDALDPLGDARMAQCSHATKRAEKLPAKSAYVAYTSGTTGQPKGVIVPHRALVNLLGAMGKTLAVDGSIRLLAVTPLTFDIAALELLLPLTVGGSVVIATRDDVRAPSRVARLIGDHGVNAMQATPTLWQSLLSERGGAALRGLLLLTGGEMLPGHLARRLFELSPTVFNLYGPTETTIWSTAHRLNEYDLDEPPVGTPIANTELFILDGRGRPLPDGVVGELAIGGEGVAYAYLGQPGLTAERFVDDPYGRPGRRAYRTGDRAAREPSGVIRLFGRGDDQIKIRGMRIEPGEVETALMRLAAVAQAAVVAERETPQAAPVLAAYLVPAEREAPFDAAAIRQQLASFLPAQMIPSRIVALEALPRTTSGKLDRAALRRLDAAVVETAVVTARSPAERMLSELWCSLLGVGEVDVNANFFDLGGDSLMVLQLVAALSERGHELPVGQIFAMPTIAALAPHFERAAPPRDPLACMLPIRDGGQDAPIFCIHPVIGVGWGFSGLASLLPDRHPVYALQHARPVLEDRPADDLRGLARMHLEKIRRIQPSGPYHLVGWSMGGLLAHAIAGALRDENEAVAMLVLLDAYPYQDYAAAEPIDGPGTVRAVMDFLSISLPPNAPAPKSLDELADAILAVELARVPAPLRMSGGAIDKLAADLRRVTLHNIDLVRSFRPLQIDTDMIFVRAGQRGGSGASALINDSVGVWNRHNTGSITRYDLDCRHQDMLQPGHIDKLAAIITYHLDASLPPGFGYRAAAAALGAAR